MKRPFHNPFSRPPTKQPFPPPHVSTKTSRPTTFLQNMPTTPLDLDPTKLPNICPPPTFPSITTINPNLYTPNLPLLPTLLPNSPQYLISDTFASRSPLPPLPPFSLFK